MFHEGTWPRYETCMPAATINDSYKRERCDCLWTGRIHSKRDECWEKKGGREQEREELLRDRGKQRVKKEQKGEKYRLNNRKKGERIQIKEGGIE